MPINQSFSWWCFANRELADQDLMAAAKQIGYAGCELVPLPLHQAARDNGLVIAAHAGHQGISSGLNDPREHDRIESEIKTNLENAVKFGIPTLITFSGERTACFSDYEGLINCAKGLRRVTKAAEEAGIYLSMELLNSKVDHKQYQCDHTEWGAALCEMVDSDRVKLLYDIYHMQIMEGDVIRTIRANSQYISHYHTAGNPGRRDMDDTQELCYPPIMRAILETEYTGYVGHEFVPKGPAKEALKAAFDLCNV